MKVLIVDDELLIRSGLSILLQSYNDVEVVGQAENGAKAFEFVQTHQVDVVLMDIRMPEVNGIEGTRMILEWDPSIRILILTTFQDTEYIAEAMRLGASGYLLKDSSHEEIYEGLKLALANKVILDQQVSNLFVASAPAKKTMNDMSQYDLNDKEIDIIKHIAHGLNNREISEKMFLSEGTIKNNVSYILTKLQLRDRTQLAIFAYENHIVN